MERPVAPAVERVFEILELFESEQRALNLREIVEWLGYPTSTTSSVLRSMVVLGYLHHDRSSRLFTPTIRLAHLGSWCASRALPGQSCMDLMRRLAAETGEIIYLAHRNDIYLQYLHAEVGVVATAPPQPPGATRFLVQSALGWALMSFLDRRAIASIIKRTNAVLPPPDACDPATVTAAVDVCLHKGFATTENTIRLGHGVIAVPFALTHRRLSLGIAAPVDRLRSRTKEYSEKLTEAVATLSGS